MTTVVKYRKSKYATKYADIMQNLTKDNLDTYLLDILNILCIPHNIWCYNSRDSNNNNYKDSAQFVNGVLHTSTHIIFKQVELNKNFWGNYSSYHRNIDISKLLILYNIAKLICTVKLTYIYLHHVDANKPCNKYTLDLHPESTIGNILEIERYYYSIVILFGFNENTPAIDAIKTAIHDVYCNGVAIVAVDSIVPSAPIAVEVEKSDNTSQSTLVEAKLLSHR